MNFKIRKITQEDARICAQIHVQSWRETYRGIVPDEYLDSLDVEKRIDLWKININDNALSIYVAEVENMGVVGFFIASANRSPSFQDFGEICAIYLLKKYHHQGIGRALFNRAFRVLKERGFKKVSLWALKDNPTVVFYSKMGGRVDREKEIEIGGKKLIEYAYCWDEIIEPHIFHITARSQWDLALIQKFYEAPSLKKEGFIHFSCLHQVHRSGNLWCKDLIDPIVLEVDPLMLNSALKYESVDDSEFFPHVYGAIPIETVINVRVLKKNSSGLFEML